MNDSTTPTTSPTTDSPSGIGGWLILPIIGLFVAPLFTVFVLLNDVFPLFSIEYWSALTNPDGEYYHPLWATVLIFETVGNLIVIAACVFLLVLCFQKNHRFPSFMVIFYIANFLFLLTDFVLVLVIVESVEAMGEGALKDVMQSALAAAIWIPYFIRSERVKNTFVNGTKPANSEDGFMRQAS